MIDDLKVALGELDLSPKEAEVYLAMLELGPTSVQDIAKKAGVNRSTTYVMLEGLKRHGLISSYEKGKKTVFVAESPQRLTSIIGERMEVLRKKKNDLQDVLPRLLAMHNAMAEKPKVRFFEGDESAFQIVREVVELNQPLWEFYSIDEHLKKVMDVEREERVRHSKKVRGRALFAIKPGFHVPYFDTSGVETRVIDYKKHPFSGDLGIIGDRVYLVSLLARGQGIVIESKELASVIRTMFEVAWSCALPWTPPEDWSLEKHG